MSATEPFDLPLFLKNLPNLPGVYRFFDEDNNVLYVGKAVNLKRRVSSYFQKNDHSPRIALMVKQVHHIETTITRSEAEALILENNFIKALSPKYNILFRDDKSYPYLMLSGHQYPQMAYYRGTLKKPNQYFGPYPNSNAVRDSIQVLQKVFMLRTCEDSVFEHRDRPCLLYQIKRCTAPCVGHISEEDYRDSVREAATFLNGKTDELMRTLQHKMQTAAANLQFEEAARYRDQIQALGIMQSNQFIDSKNPNNPNDIDLLALAVSDGLVCVHWVSIRGGRHVGDKSFSPTPKMIPNQTDKITPKPSSPNTIWQKQTRHHHQQLSHSRCAERGFGRRTRQTDAICHQNHRRTQSLVENGGAKRTNGDCTTPPATKQPATPHRRTGQNPRHGSDGLNRLECFDISHTQGEATIASCVVYDEQNIQPSQYRRYNITTAKPGDDYAAMREVLTRRYGKMQEAEANGEAVKWPDVVLIDGGKGKSA